MKSLIVVIVTVIILSYLASQALTAKARRSNRGWIFSPVKGVRYIYFLLLLLGLGLSVLGVRGSQADRQTVLVGSICLLMFAAVTWPKAIEIFESGVRQRSWYGAWRTILWTDIGEIVESRDGSIRIQGQRTKIVFSKFYPDRQLFLERINQEKSR